jgi:hypothetical protein
MSELIETLGNSTIKKGANLLGLTLSDCELNELELGKYISLENRSLSEIGSIFILASAIADTNGCKIKKNITFGDLPKVIAHSGCSSGIPVYCWQSESSGKLCLYLTLIGSKPVIRISNHE